MYSFNNFLIAYSLIKLYSIVTENNSITQEMGTISDNGKCFGITGILDEIIRGMYSYGEDYYGY